MSGLSAWEMFSLQPLISVWAALKCATLLLLSVMLLLLNGAWLLSEAHSANAWQLLRAGLYDEPVLESAALSSHLAPLSAEKHKGYANVLASYHLLDKADAEFTRALRISPADPAIWQDYVRFKLYADQHDRDFEHAVARVYTLAPNDFGLQADHAWLALTHWDRVSPNVRAYWTNSIQAVVRERTAITFLKDAMAQEREELLCKNPQFGELKIEWWCYWALKARSMCFASYRDRETREWCNQIGLAENN